MSNEMNEMNVEAGLDENFIDDLAQVDDVDVNEEKIKEMNKHLPKWSLEPPQGFLK